MQTKRKTMIVTGAAKGIGAGARSLAMELREGRHPVQRRRLRKGHAQHVRNAVARFDQVIDVSDADRALAFANIEKAANYYDVSLPETSWHELCIHPQKSRREAATKGAVTCERRVPS